MVTVGRLLVKCMLIIGLSMSVGALPGKAAETISQIKIGIYDNPPLFYVNSKGDASGFFVDLMRAISRRHSWNIVFVPIQQTEVFQKLSSNQIQLAFIRDDFPELDNTRIHSSRETWLNCRGVVYTAHKAQIHGIRDLEGKRIAMVAQDPNAKIIKQVCQALELTLYPVWVSDYLAGFKAVQRLGADACVVGEWFGRKKANEFGLYETPIKVKSSRWVVATHHQQDQKILDVIDTTIGMWKENPDLPYHHLSKYWLNSEVDRPQSISFTKAELAWLETHSKIRVAFDGYFPPYSYLTEDGQIEGLAVDVMRMLTDRLDIEMEIVPVYVWNDLFKAAVQRNVDIVATMVKRPERLKWFHFTHPYIHKSLVIVTRQQDKAIDSRDDLPHKTVAMVRGYQYVKRILTEYPDIVPFYVDTMMEAFNAVATGKADAAISFFGAGRFIQLKYGISNLKYAAIYDKNSSNESIGVRNDWPELVSILDKALYSIGPDQWLALQKKWNSDEAMVVYFEQDVVSRKEWFIIISLLSVVGGFLCLTLIGYCWNRMLKRQVMEKTRSLETELAVNRQMAGELEKSEKKFRYLFDHAMNGLIICDQNGAILEANETVCRMLHYSKEELMKLPVFVLEDSDQIRTTLEEGLQQGRFLETDFISQEHSPSIPVEVFIHPIDFQDQSCYLIGILDITEKKQAQSERNHLQTQLQEVRKMEAIGRLAGGIAHDFNNMLMVILGHVEMAMDQLDSDASILTNLKEIHNAASRSADLTRNLLAFARKQFIQPRVLDIQDLIQQRLAMLIRLTGEHIDIQWRPYPESIYVKMDPSQLDQILINLITNARDAIEGTGNVNIATSPVFLDAEYCQQHPGTRPGNYVRISVSDTGQGMDPSIQNCIFEPFFTTKQMGKGTGMGLSTVYGIVTQNNGFITVYSEPQKGTTFNVYLPRISEYTMDAPTKAPETDVCLGGNETILIVEDESAILEMIQTILEPMGYRVLVCHNPQDAVEMAAAYSGDIHLLLTDVIMPDMDGSTLSDRLSRYFPSMATIYMSGYPSNYVFNQKIIQAGMPFIQKPFSKDDLLKKIRKILDGQSVAHVEE